MKKVVGMMKDIADWTLDWVMEIFICLKYKYLQFHEVSLWFLSLYCAFFITLRLFYQRRHIYLTYKILKFTLKHFFTVTPTCFSPGTPSSGSQYWAWPKLLFCRYNQ